MNNYHIIKLIKVLPVQLTSDHFLKVALVSGDLHNMTHRLTQYDVHCFRSAAGIFLWVGGKGGGYSTRNEGATIKYKLRQLLYSVSLFYE